MSVRLRSLTATFVAVTAIAAGCGAGAPSASGQPPRAAVPGAIAASGTATPAAALATDQGCTAQAAAGATLQTTRYRPDDLAAMTVPRASLGRAVSAYPVNWLRYGYMDNVELPHLGVHPKGECMLSRTSGRIVGFARSFTGPIQTVGTQVDLFFTGAGAARWVSGFASGLRAARGTQGISSVTVSSAPTLGTGAVRITSTCTAGCVWTWVMFRRGALVGTVLDQRDKGTAPVVNMTTAARTLSARMASRTSAVNARAQDPADAVMALSAGLPRSALGPKYAGLVWDWFYGGCWDPAEAVASTGDARRGTDAKKYGELTFCRAMYVPPNGRTTFNGVERVYTGGSLFKTASGAHGQFAVNVARDRAARNTVRLSVGALGAEAAGFQTRGTPTVTRIYFRIGRYLATVTLVTRGITGMVGTVKRWAPVLDSRVTALLAHHST